MQNSKEAVVLIDITDDDDNNTEDVKKDDGSNTVYPNRTAPLPEKSPDQSPSKINVHCNNLEVDLYDSSNDSTDVMHCQNASKFLKSAKNPLNNKPSQGGNISETLMSDGATKLFCKDKYVGVEMSSNGGVNSKQTGNFDFGKAHGYPVPTTSVIIDSRNVNYNANFTIDLTLPQMAKKCSPKRKSLSLASLGRQTQPQLPDTSNEVVTLADSPLKNRKSSNGDTEVIYCGTYNQDPESSPLVPSSACVDKGKEEKGLSTAEDDTTVSAKSNGSSCGVKEAGGCLSASALQGKRVNVVNNVLDKVQNDKSDVLNRIVVVDLMLNNEQCVFDTSKKSVDKPPKISVKNICDMLEEPKCMGKVPLLPVKEPDALPSVQFNSLPKVVNGVSILKNKQATSFTCKKPKLSYVHPARGSSTLAVKLPAESMLCSESRNLLQAHIPIPRSSENPKNNYGESEIKTASAVSSNSALHYNGYIKPTDNICNAALQHTALQIFPVSAQKTVQNISGATVRQTTESSSVEIFAVPPAETIQNTQIPPQGVKEANRTDQVEAVASKRVVENKPKQKSSKSGVSSNIGGIIKKKPKKDIKNNSRIKSKQNGTPSLSIPPELLKCNPVLIPQRSLNQKKEPKKKAVDKTKSSAQVNQVRSSFSVVDTAQPCTPEKSQCKKLVNITPERAREIKRSINEKLKRRFSASMTAKTPTQNASPSVPTTSTPLLQASTNAYSAHIQSHLRNQESSNKSVFGTREKHGKEGARNMKRNEKFKRNIIAIIAAKPLMQDTEVSSPRIDSPQSNPSVCTNQRDPYPRIPENVNKSVLKKRKKPAETYQDLQSTADSRRQNILVQIASSVRGARVPLPQASTSGCNGQNELYLTNQGPASKSVAKKRQKRDDSRGGQRKAAPKKKTKGSDMVIQNSGSLDKEIILSQGISRSPGKFFGSGSSSFLNSASPNRIAQLMKSPKKAKSPRKVQQMSPSRCLNWSPKAKRQVKKPHTPNSNQSSVRLLTCDTYLRLQESIVNSEKIKNVKSPVSRCESPPSLQLQRNEEDSAKVQRPQGGTLRKSSIESQNLPSSNALGLNIEPQHPQGETLRKSSIESQNLPLGNALPSYYTEPKCPQKETLRKSSIESPNLLPNNAIPPNTEPEIAASTSSTNGTKGKENLQPTENQDNVDNGFPYYLKIFMTVIMDVISNSYNWAALSPEETEIVMVFCALPSEAKKLYVRLYDRNFTWFRRSNIKYPEIAPNLNSTMDILVENRLCDTDLEREDLPTILNILQVKELRQLCNEFHIPSEGTKKVMVQNLVQHGTQQQQLMGNGEMKPLTAVIKNRAGTMLGDCIKLKEEPRTQFRRIMLLFSLPLCQDDDLYKVTLLQLQDINYCKHEGVRTRAIFLTRDYFLMFEEAHQKEAELMNLIQQKNWRCAQEYVMLAKEQFMNIMCNKNLREHDTSLPVFLRKFTAGSTWGYMLSYGVDVICKQREYEEAVQILDLLLSQDIYLKYRRGYWFERLALIHHVHLKNPEKAVDVILEAMRDPEVTIVGMVPLTERMKMLLKMKKPLKLSEITRKSLEDLKFPELRDPVCCTIEGKSLQRNLPGLKMFYIQENAEGSNESIVSSVEELAVSHYKRLGYLEGLHAESITIITIYGLLFWDIIYNNKVPDVFQNPFQSYPLDLSSPEFYLNRKEAIDNRIKEMLLWTREQMDYVLDTRWKEHEGESCIVSWNRFRNSKQVQELVACIGVKVMSKICERLAKEYRFARSGFPDLIVWTPNQINQYKFVEVKGPKDRLAPNQKVWLDYLASIGASAEVCYVKSVCQKKLKKPTTLHADNGQSCSTVTLHDKVEGQ